MANMSRVITFLLTGLGVAVLCVATQAASRRPPGEMVYYHFNGQGFIAGQSGNGGPFVAVGERLRPVVLSGSVKIEPVGLAHGQGAIAGICYIQSSGGKLASGAGYAPCRRMQLRITSGEAGVTTVTTDEDGYFIAVLDAGMYRIGDAPLTIEVRVEVGQTTLVPLRAGKRMVD
jgi:hypothetical protein